MQEVDFCLSLVRLGTHGLNEGEKVRRNIFIVGMSVRM